MAAPEMSKADIEEAIKSITERKDNLRKSFELLQSYSSSIVRVTLQWKDIEGYISSIEKYIAERFHGVKNLDSSLVSEKPATAVPPLKIEKKHDKPELRPRPDLKTLCLDMDGNGLISFITDNRKDTGVIQRELGPALLCAPDPVTFVLDLLDSFIRCNKTIGGGLQSSMRSYSSILEGLKGLSLEIKPQARDRARELAVKWKEMMNRTGNNEAVVLSFLFLVATFGLVESFGDGYILDLIILLGWRRCMINLCRNCELEEKMPDLVNRFIEIKKPLVAVRLVLAFNLEEKYPPASLLNAHVNNSKMSANELRHRGKGSGFSKNEVNLKEVGDLKAVIKTVEEYKLESVYPCDNLWKRIKRLERRMINMSPERKRRATFNAVTSSNFVDQKHPHRRPNKRTRPSTTDQAPYAEFTGSYSISGAAPSIYTHPDASFPADYVGVGALHAPSMPFFYPPGSLPGSSYYDWAMMNGSYEAGLPVRPPYNPLFYP